MTAWGGRRVQRARAIVIALHGPTCWLCGQAIRPGQAWDVDHVIPRSEGGSDALANLRPAHASCNRSRGRKQAVSWEL